MEAVEKLDAVQVKEKLKEFVSENIGLGNPVPSSIIHIRSKVGDGGLHYRQSPTLYAYVGHEPKLLREKVHLLQKETRIDMAKGQGEAMALFLQTLRYSVNSKTKYSWYDSEVTQEFDWLREVIEGHYDFYRKYLEMPMVQPFFYVEHKLYVHQDKVYVDAIISMGFEDFVSRVTVEGTPLLTNVRLNISDQQIQYISDSVSAFSRVFNYPEIFSRYNRNPYPQTKHEYSSVLLESLRQNLEIGPSKETFEQYTRLMYKLRHTLGIDNPNSLPEVVLWDDLSESDRSYIAMVTSLVVNHFQLVVEFNKKNGTQV